jgi:hypothetical protein
VEGGNGSDAAIREFEASAEGVLKGGGGVEEEITARNLLLAGGL